MSGTDKLMRRLKFLFQRAAPYRDEIQILRGILSAAQGIMRRVGAGKPRLR
jgi:tRNA C32,U32 (ribose-2'-O)-methylase TrmJ